jgi:hypothetical protein
LKPLRCVRHHAVRGYPLLPAVLVTGTSILDVFHPPEVLESTAKAVVNARTLGHVATMSDSVIAKLRAAFGLKTEEAGRPASDCRCGSGKIRPLRIRIPAESRFSVCESTSRCK